MELFYLVSFLDCSLQVYRNIIDICMLALYSPMWQNSFISSNCSFFHFLVLSIDMFMSSMKSNILLFQPGCLYSVLANLLWLKP